MSQQRAQRGEKLLGAGFASVPRRSHSAVVSCWGYASAVNGSRASGLLGDGCRRAYGRRHVDEGGGQEQGGEGDAEQGEAAERER